MAVYSPTGVASSRNRNAIWCDAIADIHNPTVAELTSELASLDISCWLNSDWDGPSASQNKETDERWCGNKYESMGDVEWSMGDLVYVDDPQATDSQGTGRARLILTEGKRGYIVMRLGVNMDTPIAARQKVDIYSVQLGAGVPAATAKNEPLRRTQAVAVIGNVAQGVTVVA